MKARQIISSWWLTVALVAAGAASYVAYAQGEDAYDKWSQLVMHTVPGAILYFALLINLVAASARIAMDALRPKAGDIEEMDEHVSGPASALPDVPHKSVPDWLRAAGFHVTVHRDDIIGIRGRWSFLPGLVLRAGLVLMLLALGASAHVRKSDSRIMHATESAELLGLEVKVRGISATLPDDYLQVGDRSEFELDGLSVDLTIDGEAARVTSGYAAHAGGLYMRATSFGYHIAPLLRGVAIAEDLDVLPPGKNMHTTTGLSVWLEPAKTVTRGLLTGKSYNIRAPRFRMKMIGIPEAVVLGPGEASGLIALGPDGGYFVRIQAVRDPALMWVNLGGALFLAGCLLMLTRLLWYRRTIVARAVDANIAVGQSSELYGNWNVERFRIMLSELGLGGPPASEDEPGPTGRDQ